MTDALQNLALNKPALQSSVHRASAGDAAIANNGDKSSPRCFHTNHERDPWWQVDLQGVFLLDRVKIYNRLEQAERLRDFSVLRSCDGRDWVECGRRASREAFAEAALELSGENVARFVRIRMNGMGFLHFRECEVFGRACGPEDAARLLEADERLFRRRNFVPEGRRGEVVEVAGFHVFVDDGYGPNVRAALRGGGYEQIEREMVAQFLAPGDRVIEAGTAVGIVAMTAAGVVGAGNVATFDANPLMIEDARLNFARNGLEAIRSAHGLLANRRHHQPGATARFGVAQEFWASRLANGPEPDIVRFVDTPVFCLEDEIEAFGANVLICDIEGAEVDLLPEADLSRLRLIILETHYWARGEDATDEMIARLTQMGFAIHLGASRHNVVVMRRRVASNRAP